MTATLNIDEVDLVVIAQNHNPSILNPDFLIRTGIVESSWGWELANPPICTQQFSGVMYKSGLSIQAFLDRLIFREKNQGNTIANSKLSRIARKYIETLPHVSYSSIGTNTKGHIVVESDEKAALYILNDLVNDGPWKKFADGPMDATLSLAYRMSDCVLNLGISRAKVKAADKSESPCIVFAANFHRELKGESHEAKHHHLLDIIDKWGNDYKTFISLIKERFLKEKTT